jgi:hypothetical protein
MRTNVIIIAGFFALLVVGSSNAVEKTKVQPGYIQPAKERIQEAAEDSTQQLPADDQEASEEPSSSYPEYIPNGEGSSPYSAADSITGDNDPVPPTGEIALPAPIPDDPSKVDPP